MSEKSLRKIALRLFAALLLLSADAVSSQAIESPSAMNLMNENSTISGSSQDGVISAPVLLPVAGSYYSAHPISVGLSGAIRTTLSNAASSTSMSHDVSGSQGIRMSAEYSASSTSIQSDWGSDSYSSTHMQIDDNVTRGMVSIGVLSGDGSAGRRGIGGHEGSGMMTSAWKNPAIEIEEEYVGSYHITKNFTINNSYSTKWGWAGISGCYACAAGYVLSPPEPVKFMSADDVFNPARYPYPAR